MISNTVNKTILTKGLKLAILFFLMLYFYSSGQNTIKQPPNIPLDTFIQITIIRLDSSELDCYNVYYFNYWDKKARFIVDKLNDPLKQFNATKYKLCRIVQFCYIDTISGKRIYYGGGCAKLTGNAYYINGEKDLNHPNYYFDEFSSFPTLRLCDQE